MSHSQWEINGLQSESKPSQAHLSHLRHRSRGKGRLILMKANKSFFMILHIKHRKQKASDKVFFRTSMLHVWFKGYEASRVMVFYCVFFINSVVGVFPWK